MSTLRPIGVVAVALVLAACLLRPQVSSALVSRGDDLAFRGNASRALEMYARASAVDSSNTSAVDRYAFAAIMSHNERALTAAMSFLNRSIDEHPNDLTLRMDRALCEQRLLERTNAARDFAMIGERTRDPRALMFAALDVASTRQRYSEHLLRLALVIEPRFTPARAALERVLGGRR